VWIGSNANGLSVFEGGRFRMLAPAESPPTRNIAGLVVDSRGDLWIGSAANGLFRRRHGRYEPFGVAQGLGDRLIAVVVEDRDANLWVCTARGISRLERAKIEAVAEGRAASLEPIILDRADGLLNPEGSGGGLDPSGLRDRDGRIWISTIGGIAVIDQRRFRPTPSHPAC
jgi:ligand-binding sensor domain-containing protein